MCACRGAGGHNLDWGLTFVVLDVHGSLCLQQQRDELCVAIKCRMVQSREPGDRGGVRGHRPVPSIALPTPAQHHGFKPAPLQHPGAPLCPPCVHVPEKATSTCAFGPRMGMLRPHRCGGGGQSRHRGVPLRVGVPGSPLPTDPLPQQHGHEHRWQRCPRPVTGLAVGWGKPPAPHPLCSHSSRSWRLPPGKQARS